MLFAYKMEDQEGFYQEMAVFDGQIMDGQTDGPPAPPRAPATPPRTHADMPIRFDNDELSDWRRPLMVTPSGFGLSESSGGYAAMASRVRTGPLELPVPIPPAARPHVTSMEAGGRLAGGFFSG